MIDLARTTNWTSRGVGEAEVAFPKETMGCGDNREDWRSSSREYGMYGIHRLRFWDFWDSSCLISGTIYAKDQGQGTRCV